MASGYAATDKRTTSYSFHPSSFSTAALKSIPATVFNHRQEEAEARELILITDQSYPACLPSMDNQKCVVSIRVENGGMRELFSKLLEATRGMKPATGKVILVYSISNLAAVGTAAYIDNLAAMRRFIKKARGEGVLVGALPRLTNFTITNPSVGRQLLDVCHWMMGQDARDKCALLESTRTALDILCR